MASKRAEFERPGAENSSGSWQEFVAVDARGDSARPVVRLDTHDFCKASNVHIAGLRDFARQGENKFDGRTRRKLRFNQKVQAAETDVTRLSLLFAAARLGRANR